MEMTVPEFHKKYNPSVSLRTVQDYVKKFNTVLERDGLISVSNRDKKRIQVKIKMPIQLLKTINDYYKDRN